MEPSLVPIYYLSSLVGLVMVAGGSWLIHREKIYIDSVRNRSLGNISSPEPTHVRKPQPALNSS